MYLFTTNQALFKTFLDRMGVKLGSVILREEESMRVSKEDIWCKIDEVILTGEDCIMRSFMGCTPHQMLVG